MADERCLEKRYTCDNTLHPIQHHICLVFFFSLLCKRELTLPYLLEDSKSFIKLNVGVSSLDEETLSTKKLFETTSTLVIALPEP